MVKDKKEKKKKKRDREELSPDEAAAKKAGARRGREEGAGVASRGVAAAGGAEGEKPKKKKRILKRHGGLKLRLQSGVFHRKVSYCDRVPSAFRGGGASHDGTVDRLSQATSRPPQGFETSIPSATPSPRASKARGATYVQERYEEIARPTTVPPNTTHLLSYTMIRSSTCARTAVTRTFSEHLRGIVTSSPHHAVAATPTRSLAPAGRRWSSSMARCARSPAR